MRLDKFLKVSRIIKRRTVAGQACDSDRVLLNGRQAKAGSRVKEGDIIELALGNHTLKAEILSIVEHTTKSGAEEMYRILE